MGYRYFVESETPNQNHSKCRKFAQQNFITEQIDLSFADIYRRYDDLCGPNVKYKEVVKSDCAQLLIPLMTNFDFLDVKIVV